MKQVKICSGLIISLFLLLTFSSCEKEEKTYSSVTGSWRCEENNPVDGIRSYLVEIDSVKSETDLYLISNFYDADYNEFVFARLSGNEFTISNQVITSLFVNGTGTVNEDYTQIDWEYEIDDGIQEISVFARYTRD
jgi:hypothetical protein